MADVAASNGGGEVPMKRRRTSASPSPRPERRQRAVSPAAPISIPRLPDTDAQRRRERERQMALDMAESELAGSNAAKPKIDLKQEMKKAAQTKLGGVYIPPHRLKAMLAEAEEDDEDKEGAEYQRLTWEALRKSINGLINKVNVSNIKLLVPELFGENLIRGRGLFVRSIMRAQASSLPFTPVFASLVAIINTKLPQIGELLLTRLISQFRRSFRRNDKPTMIATTTFLAHLCNQQVAHELLALQVLVLLLEKPTDDSVEIAVSFMKEVGAFLAEASPKGNNGVFERFRAILYESGIDKRVQYMVEVLFQVRKDKFKDNPIIPEGLDLVEEEDAITHKISLDDELQTQDMLNVFKYDPNYAENEEKYREIKTEILGEDSEEESGTEGDSEESDEEEEADTGIKADGTLDVHDHTEANLVNLRRTIYLTIMSALDFEEAVHKLLKIQLADNHKVEMCNMVIECCSQERTFSKFYGLIGERFCKLNNFWSSSYEGCFATYYNTIHRYETNRLRNIARFFGHLLATDAIAWSVLDVIKMNEDDTTSSSRIFVKIMFQEITEHMGLKNLVERLKEDAVRPYLNNIFPTDNPKNTRFSINFFTSIGLGAVTEEMRTWLQNAPKMIMEQRKQLEAESSDSDSSSSLSSSTLSSSSRSSYDSRRRSRRSPSYSRSPSPRYRDSRGDSGRRRSPSYSSASEDEGGRSRRPPPRRRSPSYTPERRDDRDRRRSPSPAGRRRRSPSYSRSPSPPPRRSARRSPTPDRRGPAASRGRSPSPIQIRGQARRPRSPSPSSVHIKGSARASGSGGRPRSPSPEPERRAASPPAAAPSRDFMHPDRRRMAEAAERQAQGGRGGGYGGGRPPLPPARGGPPEAEYGTANYGSRGPR